MKTHEFTIVASGLDPEMEGYEDRFLVPEGRDHRRVRP
jgi:hypothetical protein